jgi:hypothetical protein
MSVLTRQLAIGSFTVGGSAAMPVVKIAERHEHESPEQANGAKLLRTTWTIDSYAIAATAQDLGALKQTIIDRLTKRGEAVVLIERADAGTPDPGTRTLAAGGSTGGPLLGYPRCSVELLPDDSYGIKLAFRCTIESVAPATGLTDPIWHEFETATDTDRSESVTIRRSGRVRVANGSSAETWVRTNIIDPARADADTDGRRFTDRVTVGLDAAECTYEYTDQEPGPNGFTGGGIEDASVTVRERRQRNGSSTETTSGYAIGSSATTYAENQRPSVNAFRVIVNDQIGAPSIPEGRVDFSYEVRIGKTVPGLFSDAVVFEYSHSIAKGGGGRRIQSAPRITGIPRLWLGRNEPVAARETMTVVFLPQTAIDIFGEVGMSPSLDEDYLDGNPDMSVSRDQNGFFTASIGYRYLYDADTVLPSPRTIAGALT